MKRFTAFALILALMFGTGCASSYTRGRNSGLGLELAAPGKSKVVFVRPGQFMGDGVDFNVHDGDRLIGVVPGSSYFVYDCEPGHHLFSASMEDIAIMEADLLADRIYYAKVSSQLGVWISRVNMYSLHPHCAGDLWPQLPKILADVKETIVTPAAVADDQRGAANYMKRLEKHLSEHQGNPNREQILPEHGQPQPIVAR
jgi:hypothetical protein